MIEKTDKKPPESPLCVFCLSPAFSIRAFTRPPERTASRRFSVRSRRRDGSSLSTRPQFKPVNRRSSNSFSKYLSRRFGSRYRTLSLQEVLEEIRKAWISTAITEKISCPKIMEEKWSKSSSTSNETFSPMPLRRRLSAPETVMRKHTLAQQRSDSQDSDVGHSGRKFYQRNDIFSETGSDSNLNRKRDSDLMRKTLLRRLWGNNKPLLNNRFTGSFSEWQHSYGKLYSGRSVQSLSSVNSSPEYLVRSQSKRLLSDDLKTSPQHRKTSPKHKPYEGNRRHTFDGTTDNETTITRTSTTITTNSIRTPKTTTETETSSRYTNTSYTTFSDNYNSDSAYTNSRSNYSESSNNNLSSPSEIQKEIMEETEVSNQDVNKLSLQLTQDPGFVKYSSGNEIATQTVGTTNVNVISNVQLSQSTLDLIYNQVMRDVKSHSSDTVTESNVVQVKQIPSFFLKRENSAETTEPSRIVKCMISNVGIGSPYAKPAEAPQLVVPRFSARPHSSSMEVNMSSGEITDKDSDTVSLVDSLEDTSSFRTDPTQNEMVSNKSDVSLELPDNSDRKVPHKPTAFFIPIEVENGKEFKAVSDHLPLKVKNKLTRRQQKREEKILNKLKQTLSRSDSNYISASENGNYYHNGDINFNSHRSEIIKGKKRVSKPLLPSIESFRKTKSDRSREDDKRSSKTKPVKRKSMVKESISENMYSGHSKDSPWLPKSKNKKEKLSPIYTTKKEYVYDYGPRKFYHKTEFNDSNKRIEILEIMECVEIDKRCPRPKSKIPILINQKLPKINQRPNINRPAFLDLENVPVNDPKLDQLIANILIETLNIPEDASNSMRSPETQVFVRKEEKEAFSSEKQPKCYQRFEAIPEELSFQSSTENDASNNNEVKDDKDNSYQGKAAIAVVKDDNFSSIPKGWITFYMLHNNRGSPDSTSDEGKKTENDKRIDETVNCQSADVEVKKNRDEIKPDLTSSYSNITYDVVRREKSNYEYKDCSSSSDVHGNTIVPSQNGRYKKYNQRKLRHKSTSENEKVKQLGEWSITVSGTNSYGQFAPDLEMYLKFPDSQKTYNCPSQSDSGLGEDAEQKTHFPEIHSKQNQFKKAANKNEEDCGTAELPDINRNKTSKKQRRSESSIPTSIVSRIEPRQTRTSTRRYNLSRPKIDYSQIETPRNPISLFNDSHYAEVLKRFPEILTITGNAINQEKK